MKNVKSIIVTGVLAASLVGCATTPTIEEMSQLDGEQLSALIVGNTSTGKRDYGRWAEYIGEDLTGVGKAWGSWGEEKAAAVYTFSSEGDWCTTYPEQTHKWTGPEHEYCGVVYVNEAGKYFFKSTKRTYKPERIGKLMPIEIKTGNHYELSM